MNSDYIQIWRRKRGEWVDAEELRRGGVWEGRWTGGEGARGVEEEGVWGEVEKGRGAVAEKG